MKVRRWELVKVKSNDSMLRQLLDAILRRDQYMVIDGLDDSGEKQKVKVVALMTISGKLTAEDKQNILQLGGLLNIANELREAGISLADFNSTHPFFNGYKAAETRNQWQPIETAPKDGTWILACTLHHVGVVKWEEPCFEGDCYFQDECGEWVNDLTHWMPLPAPAEVDE